MTTVGSGVCIPVNSKKCDAGAKQHPTGNPPALRPEIGFSTELVGELTDASGNPTGKYVSFGVGADWSSNSNGQVEYGGTGGPFDIATFKSDPDATYIPGSGAVTIDQIFETYGSMDVASAVPEPSTRAMLIVGLTGLGLVARRRIA